MRAAAATAHLRTSRADPGAPRAELPALASESVRLRDPSSGAFVEVAWEHARPVAAETIDGARVFVSALGTGADAVIAPVPDGYEDYVLLASRPPRAEMRWNVRASSDIAGLRVVGNTVEWISASGTPLLRMHQPWVIDAKGGRHLATADVDDCKVDRDPRGPWNRPTTAPGAPSCTVTVRWDPDVAYPVVVDPAWTTTGSMATARLSHTAHLLASGKVLMLAGHEIGGGTLSTCELYDPGTATFSSTGSLATARSHHASVVLGNGKVLACGGFSNTCELYDPASGAWSAAASYPEVVGDFALVWLPSQSLALGVGGKDGPEAWAVRSKTAALYHPAANDWTTGVSSTFIHTAHSATLLDDGRVLVAGSELEVYDPATGVWSAGPAGTVKPEHAAAKLADGKVLLAGGGDAFWNQPGARAAFLYEPSTNALSALPDMNLMRGAPRATLLDNGRVLVSGGWQALSSPIDPGAEMYDPSTKTWILAGALSQGRLWGTQTRLASGVVLIAGGRETNTALSSAELFTMQDAGVPCASSYVCKSRTCVDGVCCDTACSQTCQACTAALTGGADGTCAPAKAGLDPHDDCEDQGMQTCGKDGACDGSGLCRTYADGSLCSDQMSCESSKVISLRCKNGACMPTSTSCSPYTCGGASECGTQCISDAECSTDAWCDGATNACKNKGNLGAACSSPGMCMSGFCADGVCCTRACDGPCEVCNLPNGKGTCVPVTGAPRQGHPACPSFTGADLCKSALCDGKDRTSCQAFVDSTVVCQEAACSAGMVTLEATCDGLGHCTGKAPLSCDPYACAGKACGTSCSNDAGCASKFRCESAACIPKEEISSCAQASQVQYADGGLKDCSPYACKVGQTGAVCMSTCSSSADCAAGFVCDSTVENGRCINAGAADADNGGCGCRTAPARVPAPAGLAALAIAAVGILRRRKRKVAAAALAAVSVAGCTGEAHPTNGQAPEAQANETLQAMARQVQSAGMRWGAPAALAGPGRIEARVATRAGAGFEVKESASGMVLEVRRTQVRDVAGREADGSALFQDAVSGGDLVVTASASGVEEYTWLRARPQTLATSYAVTHNGVVAGLRVFGQTVEWVDAGGIPRIRMERPWLVDAAGARRWAHVSAEGCAIDVSPAAPWYHAPTAPGAWECTIVVRWDEAGLRYPIVVDPGWTATSALDHAYEWGGFTMLADGRVMGSGFVSPGSDQFFTMLFDPATNTWTPGAPPNTPRAGHTTTLLADGRVLISGGNSQTETAMSSAEVYEPSTGQWQATGALQTARSLHAATRLSSGKVLVTGGADTYLASPPFYSSAELYDPATGTWAAAAPMSSGRGRHSSVLLKDGRVFVAGESTTELYDPSAASWSAGPNLVTPRRWHAAELLSDGRVLLAGGYTGSMLKSSEVFDPAASTMTKLGELGVGRYAPALHQLANGRVLVAGGNDIITVTEWLDLATGQWSGGAELPESVSGQLSARLQDGSVLVAGGWHCTGGTCFGEELSWRFSLSAQADACVRAADCVTGYCVDGYCCDAACTGTCRGCSAAVKGSGSNGTCEPFGVGMDPDDECASSSEKTCGLTGMCDGAGHCALYPAATVCLELVCSERVLASGKCNGTGTCVIDTLDCGLYTCASATACGTGCQSAADCAPDAWCDSNAQKCAAKLSQGAPCDTGESCATGFCADGHCCDSACTGQCEACDLDGGEGVCVPVQGAPHAGRTPCASAAGDLCKEAMCDGQSRTACNAFAGSGVQCRAPSCSDGVAVLAAGCDGKGACPQLQTHACGAFACKGDACATQCAAPSDCAPGFVCSGNDCKPDEGSATCKDSHTVLSPDGKTTAECAPYVCEAPDGGKAQCRSACATAADCTQGHVCDSNKACVAASDNAAATEEQGGCGCRTAPGRTRFAAWGWILLGLAAVARRARRV